MMKVQTQERWGPTGRPTTRYCEVAGCHTATREGKPYCSEHVEQHPYVQGLLEQLAAREAEEERVSKRGARAVDVAGLTAQEILQFVRVHGSRTVQRLARELNMEVKVVAAYARALKRKKLVTTTTTRRGSTIVNLNLDNPEATGEPAAGEGEEGAERDRPRKTQAA